MTIETNTPFLNDITDCVKLFDASGVTVLHTLFLQAEGMLHTVAINQKRYEYQFSFQETADVILNKRMVKRFSKLAVFYALSDYFQKKLPWGGLTGIRPTKFFYELGEHAESDLKEIFRVTDSKIQLLKDIAAAQKSILNTCEKVVDIYVSIPFCTSRCVYCSFLSSQIDKCEDLIEDYLTCLKTEISALKDIIKSKGYQARCIYVGGGTPTSITGKQIESLLKVLDFETEEFTFEAGRPDTITPQKLEIISSFGVQRISVNPQTFCDKTLKLIGRNHTVDDFLKSYELAKKFDFTINMDLIAGLPNETFEVFEHSLTNAISLNPDNITVHTLALKRGALLKDEAYSYDAAQTLKMVDYSYNALKKQRYQPYYLYRQKYVAESLENVGYAKFGKACKYNVDIMEENTSVLAAGGNAISKRVFLSEHRIERQANPKDIKTYLEKIDKIIEDKRNLFC